MSKYDFQLDLTQNSSTGIILDKLSKGSVVLEFGCAAGRMTRYMKEVLSCQVYIVEYDKVAFETALGYAEDGLCDDISNFQWFEKFGGIEFDAIIFADVLEHLPSPEKVLEKASKLLKDTGCIYVSIPNITHNDLLLKAYDERFDYTPTGLLDDTHVHFWGFKNIETLAKGCGLNIRSIEGTYCATGDTEQYAHGSRKQNVLLENILRERQCGEVYQFIITFDKNDRSDAAYAFRASTIKSHIYLDTGNDFNADESIAFDSEYSADGSYKAHYVITNTSGIKRVRLDPIEYQGCILQHVSITQGDKALPLICPNALEMESGIFLPGDDPMVYAQVQPKDDPIVIDADLIHPGEKYLKLLQDAYLQQYAVAEGLLKSHAALQDTYDRKRAEAESLTKKLSEMHQENGKLTNRIAALTVENEECRRDLGAYIYLSNKKDEYALELERELHYYKNLRVVKMRARVLRVLRDIKRRIKRIIRKEEH